MEDVDRERRKEFVALLEGRRLAVDASMWQAPTLTIVGQAFILRVLTDHHVGWGVATLAAAAGVLATITVGVSLAQQRDREQLLSERIAREGQALRWPDARRQALARSRCWAHPLEWSSRWLWGITIAVFGVADVVALIVGR